MYQHSSLPSPFPRETLRRCPACLETYVWKPKPLNVKARIKTAQWNNPLRTSPTLTRAWKRSKYPMVAPRQPQGPRQLMPSLTDFLFPPKSDKAKRKEKAKAPYQRCARQRGKYSPALLGPPRVQTRAAQVSSVVLITSSLKLISTIGSPALIDPTTAPPVFWTEAFSRPEDR